MICLSFILIYDIIFFSNLFVVNLLYIMMII